MDIELKVEKLGVVHYFGIRNVPTTVGYKRCFDCERPILKLETHNEILFTKSTNRVVCNTCIEHYCTTNKEQLISNKIGMLNNIPVSIVRKIYEPYEFVCVSCLDTYNMRHPDTIMFLYGSRYYCVNCFIKLIKEVKL